MTSPVVYSVLRPPKINNGRTMLRVARAETHRWRRGDRLALVAKKRVNLLQIAQGVKCTHHEIVAVNSDGGADILVLMGAVPSHDWRTVRVLDVAECERLAKSENDAVYSRVIGADALPSGHSESTYIPGIRSEVGRSRAYRPVSRRTAAARYTDRAPKQAGYVPLWAFAAVSAALLVAVTWLIILLV